MPVEASKLKFPRIKRGTSSSGLRRICQRAWLVEPGRAMGQLGNFAAVKGKIPDKFVISLPIKITIQVYSFV